MAIQIYTIGHLHPQTKTAHTFLPSPFKPYMLPAFLEPHPTPAQQCLTLKPRGGDELLCGMFTHKHTHTHNKHTHAAPAHLTPAPHQPPPWPCPQLPAQNTHGNRSWPPDISSSQCGCWAAESPWERLGHEHFLSQLPLGRPHSGTAPGGDPPQGHD